ncbi:N-acetylmuramoyl-L-alanine amidase [Acinetobacter indicus]|uniref:N-acetylmuramoyl-L-alanine amidase n=1 Tax=Acinetobacter indicus TaxID=756892 RepID=UPI00209ADC9E|nr:N-acetylmuramoyl-L-alanine amidase [Acinetobacter indicus]MCO8100112.1 N-acetylmuramoyl-L-alanine amidase [Acinetobacter indicus]MCO8105643.1 N-acetylmuramoyl-L-alanine amidase [Acinetobacter indicus]MCO8111317.1 N-acetylmuramoyl-L-alanine amidase [Acinetobacter indicus]
MKFINDSPLKYLAFILPALGAFIMLVLIPGLQWAVDYKVIPVEYHAYITGTVMVILSWIGKKIYQPALHTSPLGFVTVTAGHSNKDPGAVNGKIKESELVTNFRNAVAFYLREAGLQVKTDGTGTKNDPLSAAVKLIQGSSVAVEFHMNAAASKQANGIETIALPKDKKLAQNLSKAVANALGSRLRGDKGWIDQSKSARGRLAYVNAGGLIVELGFISNEAELAAFQARYWVAAKAVAKVLIDYEKRN